MKTLTRSSLVAAGLAVAAVLLTGATEVAAEGAWCLRRSGESAGAPRCSYATLEQCQAVYAYTNGWCEQNARVVWQNVQARQRTR